MLKLIASIVLAIALGVAAWLSRMRSERAAAQSGPYHILVSPQRSTTTSPRLGSWVLRW
jgi:hypothetical protein